MPAINTVCIEGKAQNPVILIIFANIENSFNLHTLYV